MQSLTELDVDALKTLMQSFGPVAHSTFNNLSPTELLAAVRSVSREDVDDTINLMRNYFNGDAVKLAEAYEHSPDGLKTSFESLMQSVLQQAQQVLNSGPTDLDPNVVLDALHGLDATDVLREITNTVNGEGWKLLGIPDRKELEGAVQAMTPALIKDVMEEVLADAIGRKAAMSLTH
eukprot:GHVS01000497.1.p1 GENE.GHVS01000497.1~~GHVS01000497.1.p1  ORF type:complete len:192 (+),score=40.71 GHVS01000497.1:44-577(+)